MRDKDIFPALGHGSAKTPAGPTGKEDEGRMREKPRRYKARGRVEVRV